MSMPNAASDMPSRHSSIPSTTCMGGRPSVRTAVVPTAISPSLPGFEDIQLIGEGGMGSVYRARDADLKRPVALKMIKGMTHSVDRLSRFRIEAEALARLQHPHIVQVFSWEERGHQPFLVLEYVSGGTLADVLRRGAMPLAEAVRLVAILARAVQAAHAAGVVHRDLKPSNVLLAPPIPGNSGTVCGGFPKITDFGLAQLANTGQQTAAGIVLGTPTYMAPEQAAGRSHEIGPAADVWALGVILYECLTECLPFSGRNAQEVVQLVMTAEPPSVSELRADIPMELATLCADCMRKSAAERPAPAELAERLEAWIAQEMNNLSTQSLEVPPPRHPRRCRKRKFGVAILLTLVGSGVMGALATLFRPKEDSSSIRPPFVQLMHPTPIPTERLKIPTLRVQHIATNALLGEVPVKVFPGESIKIRVTFSQPAYAFLFALTTDGEEQLLWPTAANHPPERCSHLELPTSGTMRLSDDKAGGMHAIIVVASQQPFPAFAQWRTNLEEIPWHPMPPSRSMFVDEGVGTYTIRGDGTKSAPPRGPILHKMNEVSRFVRGAPNVEVTRMFVFPVQGEEPEAP